jgi:Ca2+-binding EF-hand superfamily protein
LDEKEIEGIIHEIDKNEDGMIDYKEFLEMMKTNEKMKELIS